MVFRKIQLQHPDDFFFAESAGLHWLHAGGLPTPQIFSTNAHTIELEKLPAGTPTRRKATIFGKQLATCHRSGAEHFGSKPAGYTGGLYIGNKSMPSAVYKSWGRFYANDRVLPFIAQALYCAMLTNRDADDTYKACELINTGIFDDSEPPARIHGDLWSGNVFYSHNAVYVIDPAAHGGHRETDLAMLHLFGCFHLDSIINGYNDHYPLRSGWQARIPLHQLHPLAVHAAGQGSHYGVLLGKAARKVLALAQPVQ